MKEGLEDGWMIQGLEVLMDRGLRRGPGQRATRVRVIIERWRVRYKLVYEMLNLTMR